MSQLAEATVEYSYAYTPFQGASESSTSGSVKTATTTPGTSPDIEAGSYAFPAINTLALPQRAGPTHRIYQAVLPDIMNSDTAADVPIRNICCIGAGYVGGPTAAVIALHNGQVRVTVVDRDQGRINAWKGKHLPIREPGLHEVVRLARDGGRTHCPADQSNALNATQDGTETLDAQMRRPNLYFSTACSESIASADMILISVNTPTKIRGIGAGRATDMTAFEGAVRDIAIHARPGTILVEKSTVPCKTGQLIKEILEAHRPGVVFPVLSNPEFLSEGTAVRDLTQPDRVIIGCESTISGHRAAAALVTLYAAWVPRSKIAPINIWSSELCKLTANAMLAQRVSSINSISAICERTGADVAEIAKSIGMDPRIGPQFLKAGLGFGGSCFRKDIASLTYLAESLGLPEVAAYWQQVLTMNDFQRDRFARLVIASLNNSLRGKKIAILGYAFKKNTGDVRESPTLDVVRILLNEDPRCIAIFDPLCEPAAITSELQVLDDGRGLMRPVGPIQIAQDPYTACSESDAVLILTDWDMFKNHDLKQDPEKPCILAQHNGATPATLLNLHHTAEGSGATSNKPPTPPDSPKVSFLPSGSSLAHLPEPPCPEDCGQCANEITFCNTSEQNITVQLDWRKIAPSVKEPKWVFDGRGILDQRIMTGLGFRLETLGRASSY